MAGYRIRSFWTNTVCRTSFASWVSRNRRGVLVGIVVFLFMWFVWPTPWRYDKLYTGRSHRLVRTHRLTGATQELGFEGWTWVKSEAASGEAGRQHITAEDLAQVTGEMRLDAMGDLYGDVYNGCTHDLKGVVVFHITVRDAYGNVVVDRKIRRHVLLAAQSVTWESVKTGHSLREGETFEWSLEPVERD